MRRMVTNKPINAIKGRVDVLEQDVKYIKDHLVQYYIHFVHFSATLTSNVRVDVSINIFNNNKTAYTNFKEISDKYSSSVKFACSGYVKGASGTSYAILNVSFRGNVADVYYYDAQTQSTTYVSADFSESSFGDTVKEV